MTRPSHRMREPRQVEDLLLYRLSRLHGTAGTIVVRICEGEFGITRREWRLVAWLAEAGAMQPSALAERAALDRARTSRALSSLVAKGLATRQAVASDRRLAVVALTERGQALYEAIMPRVAAINSELLAAIDEPALRALDAALTTLQERATSLVQTMPQPKAQRRRGRRAD